MKFNNKEIYKLTKIKEFNPGKIVLDYWAAGTIEREPEIGQFIFMDRIYNKDNPDGKYGYFRTSAVKDIIKNDNNWEIITHNSTYKMEIYA